MQDASGKCQAGLWGKQVWGRQRASLTVLHIEEGRGECVSEEVKGEFIDLEPDGFCDCAGDVPYTPGPAGISGRAPLRPANGQVPQPAGEAGGSG
jgi:hypothetical protein